MLPRRFHLCNGDDHKILYIKIKTIFEAADLSFELRCFIYFSTLVLSERYHSIDAAKSLR